MKDCFLNWAMSIMESKVDVCAKKSGKNLFYFFFNIKMAETFDSCREMMFKSGNKCMHECRTPGFIEICDHFLRYFFGRISSKVRPDTGPDIFSESGRILDVYYSRLLYKNTAKNSLFKEVHI